MAVTTRTLVFPNFDRFEKENGQIDGLEFAKHKMYQGDKLAVEMTYYFNFVDSIPRKWPVKVTVVDYVGCLSQEEVVTQ